MDKNIIAQGAEAILEKKGQRIIKNRISKGYRIVQLDEKLRKTRTRKEAKLLEKAAKVMNVPKLLSSSDKSMEIEMEYLGSKKLSDVLEISKDAVEICENVGEQIAKMHDYGIIHGDLTTSNMIWKDKKVYFIDFGLGYESQNVEDKAVDLHLIKQALEAKHFLGGKTFFEAILKGYKKSKNAKEVLTRFKKVEQRGRYKQKD